HVRRSHRSAGLIETLVAGSRSSRKNGDSGSGDIGFEVGITQTRSLGRKGSKLPESWVRSGCVAERRLTGSLQAHRVRGGRPLNAQKGNRYGEPRTGIG